MGLGTLGSITHTTSTCPCFFLSHNQDVPHEKCVSFLQLSRLKYSQTSVVANNFQISYSVKYWLRVSERPLARVLERHFPRVLKRPPYLLKWCCSQSVEWFFSKSQEAHTSHAKDLASERQIRKIWDSSDPPSCSL